MKEPVFSLTQEGIFTNKVYPANSNLTSKSYIPNIVSFALLPPFILFAVETLKNTNHYFLPFGIGFSIIYLSAIVYAFYHMRLINLADWNKKPVNSNTDNLIMQISSTQKKNNFTAHEQNTKSNKFVNHTDVLEKEIVWEKGVLYQYSKEKSIVGKSNLYSRAFVLHNN